jgi:hypothetical protein
MEKRGALILHVVRRVVLPILNKMREIPTSKFPARRFYLVNFILGKTIGWNFHFTDFWFPLFPLLFPFGNGVTESIILSVHGTLLYTHKSIIVGLGLGFYT